MNGSEKNKSFKNKNYKTKELWHLPQHRTVMKKNSMVISQSFPSLLSNVKLIFKCPLKKKILFWFYFNRNEKITMKTGERTNTDKR